MSDLPTEPELRDRFAALRREDERRLPPFTRVWQAARAGHRRTPHRRRLVASATIAAAACVLLLWLAGRRTMPPSPSLTDWRPPTDFLLQTPGREILAAPGWLTRGFSAEVPAWGFGPPPNQERKAPS